MKKCFLVLSIICYFKVSAQKKEAKLNLNECLLKLENSSYVLKQVGLSMSEAVEDVKISKLNKLPNLSYSTSYGLNWGTSFNVVTNERTIIASRNSSLSFGLQVPIYVSGQKAINLKKSINNLFIWQGQIKDTKFEISVDLINNYYKSLFYKKLLNVFDRMVKTSFSQYENSKLKREVGAIAKDELLISNSSYLEDRSKIFDYHKTYDELNNQLKEQLGLNNLRDTLILQEDTVVENYVKVNTDSLINEIVNRNYKLAIQYKQIDNSILDLRLSRKSVLPQIVLSSGTSTRYDNRSISFLGPFNEQLRNNLGYFLNFGLNFSINNIINSKPTNKKLAIEVQKQFAIKGDLERNIRIDVENLLIELRSLNEREKILESFVENYKEVYNISLKKMQYGKISTLDFLQIKYKYYDAITTYLAVKYDVITKNRIIEQYLHLNI